MSNMTLPDNVVARVVMVSGNLLPDEEVAREFANYEYTQSENDPELWIMQSKDSATAGAALRLSEGGTVMDVYSMSAENFMNVNYLLQRLGWIDCRVACLNETAEQMLQMRLFSVQAIEWIVGGALQAVTTASLASASHAPVQEHVAPAAAQAYAAAKEVLNDDLQKIQRLTIQLNESEAKNAELEEQNSALTRRVQELEASLANAKTSGVASGAATAGSTASNDPLVGIFEKHFLSLLDLSSVNSSPLAKDLQAAGYAVQAKLVKVA